MSDSPDKQIKARFLVGKSYVTTFATLEGASIAIRWPREKEGVRQMRTLVDNLDKILDEGVNEVLVQDELNKLDFEIEQLYLDNDEDRPDES